MQMTSLKKNTIYGKTNGCCQYCGTKLKFEEMIITHKVPLSRGGTNATENLVPACLSCNRMKGSKTHRELRNERKTVRRKYKKRVRSVKKREKILSKTNGRCAYCGVELTLKSMTIDHIVAISRGGGNDLDNLVPACWSCNHLKDSMTLEEFSLVNPRRGRSVGERLREFFGALLSALRQLFRR